MKKQRLKGRELREEEDEEAGRKRMRSRDSSERQESEVRNGEQGISSTT